MRRGLRGALRRNLALKLVSLALAVVLYLLLRSTTPPRHGPGPIPPNPAEVSAPR
jgi:hypothetical protein